MWPRGRVALVDEALASLIERLEDRWLHAAPDSDLPGEVAVDLSSVPWDVETTPELHRGWNP